MSQFDDRERAEEKKFQLDQEQEFKAQARRAKLVGASLSFAVLAATNLSDADL